MRASSSFPWYFYWRTVRLNAAITLSLGLGLWVIDGPLALKALPLLALSSLAAAYFSYRTTKPLERVLARVTKIISSDLSHGRRIELFYRKDEWAKIEAALVEADERLQAQLKTIQAENRKFTTLLNSISNEILAIDPQANVLFFNPRFARTFISGKEKLQSGGKLWSVLDVPEARAVFEEVLQTGQSKKLKGFKLAQGNELRFYNLTVSVLPGEAQASHGAVGVFTDVTEAKLTEQMRVDFVANVSHEIRTPLTSIKGFTQILKAHERHLPPELQGFMDKILHNTERMISLFNDLLQLSVIESRDRLRIEDTSLDRLLDHVEASVQAAHPDRPLRFAHDLGVNEVRADAKLFEQVLTNLIDNACKYGGDAITVSSRKLDDMVEIRVSDNGPGIAREHLPRLFERFYRVDAARDRSSGGTGLGLAIVKHIVVKHQGEIWAESPGPGQGSSFVIRLPA